MPDTVRDGLLARYGTCTLDDDGCTTCGDRAIPVRVLARAGETATVRDRVGSRTVVAADFVPDARPGDILLVHMGVAIARVDPDAGWASGDPMDGARGFADGEERP